MIAIIVIVWLVFGTVFCFAASEENANSSVLVMIFFWPVTLPILLVFGLFYAIWTAFITGINLFKE